VEKIVGVEQRDEFGPKRQITGSPRPKDGRVFVDGADDHPRPEPRDRNGTCLIDEANPSPVCIHETQDDFPDAQFRCFPARGSGSKSWAPCGTAFTQAENSAALIGAAVRADGVSCIRTIVQFRAYRLFRLWRRAFLTALRTATRSRPFNQLAPAGSKLDGIEGPTQVTLQAGSTAPHRAAPCRVAHSNPFKGRCRAFAAPPLRPCSASRASARQRRLARSEPLRGST